MTKIGNWLRLTINVDTFSTLVQFIATIKTFRLVSFLITKLQNQKCILYQRCAIWSAILLGTTYWPFFTENPNSFVAIAIGIIFNFIFGFVLLLLVQNIKTIGQHSGYYWYCIVTVHYETFFINESNQRIVSRITHIFYMKSLDFMLILNMNAM